MLKVIYFGFMVTYQVAMQVSQAEIAPQIAQNPSDTIKAADIKNRL